MNVQFKSPRIYSTKFKSICTSLMHTSQKCYLLLKKIFHIPSMQILKQYVSTLNIHVGFMNNIKEV